MAYLEELLPEFRNGAKVAEGNLGIIKDIFILKIMNVAMKTNVTMT